VDLKSFSISQAQNTALKAILHINRKAKYKPYRGPIKMG